MKPLILAALLSISAAAAVSAPAGPPNPMPGSSVTERTLKNGLKVLVRTDAAAPLAVVDLWVRAGSSDDGGTGAAHAVEHMAFRGSEGVPEGRVDALVEAAGGVVYASTYTDATHYWAAVPPAGVPAALEALADAMRPPTVDTNAWETERRVMLEEIARARTDLSAEVRRTMSERLFGLPYGAPVAGTPDSLAKLTPEDIRAFHRRFYRPDRMAAVVVGPVDPEATFAAAEKFLGALPREGDLGASEPRVPSPSAPVEVQASDATSAFVGLAYPAPAGDDPALDVLCTVLQGRLSVALGGVASSVSVWHPWQRAGMLGILVEGAPSGEEALLAALRRALPDATREIGAAEVERAVSARAWSWWAAHEKPASQASALGMAATLGSLPEATDAPAHLEHVSVSDVRAAADAVFHATPAAPEAHP